MKQVIIIRADLKMPAGKMAAQCSHASVEAVMQSPKAKVDCWRAEGMKKIVLKVSDLNELIEYKKMAGRAKIVNCLITDAGKTVFSEPTVTCLAIGPDDDEKIDRITGKLKMV